ncbi:MAG: nitroreductase family protein [Bacteroidales bacterium]|nr:nitroreductase family protein [Bacteroidales bacterium]
MALTELMMRRRSHRKFTDEPISENDIKELQRAVLTAPTSKNCLSWHFVFVTDKEKIVALSKSKEHGATFMENATLAIVVVGDPQKTDVWVEDSSIAATYLLLKAEELGLGACWVQTRLRSDANGKMATDNVREILSIPDGFEVECVVAIGHKAADRTPYADDKLPYAQVHMEKW